MTKYLKIFLVTILTIYNYCFCMENNSKQKVFIENLTKATLILTTYSDTDANAQSIITNEIIHISECDYFIIETNTNSTLALKIKYKDLVVPSIIFVVPGITSNPSKYALRLISTKQNLNIEPFTKYPHQTTTS